MFFFNLDCGGIFFVCLFLGGVPSESCYEMKSRMKAWLSLLPINLSDQPQHNVLTVQRANWSISWKKIFICTAPLICSKLNTSQS